MKAQCVGPYDETFYEEQIAGSLSSARAVVPIVLNLLSATSVVDFGCGRCSWLKACLENGVETVLGLDGDYVKRDKVLINVEQFRPVDLCQPIHVERRFDLALCLEVGEHLPPRFAPTLVESLSSAASVVLFSAAVPGQGGTSHINEQWPAYWEKLFNERGMRKYDILRPLIWRNQSIEWWYRQNIYIYAQTALPSFYSLEQFEPEFCFVSNNVMESYAEMVNSRSWKFVAALRGLISRLRHLKCRGRTKSRMATLST